MTTHPRTKGKCTKRKQVNPYTVFFFIFCMLLVASVLLNVWAIKQLVSESLSQTRQVIPATEDSHRIANQATDKSMYQEWAEAELGYGYPYDEQETCVNSVDAEYLANVTWGEARGCSVTEQAAVMWCVLNRVDSPLYPDSVAEVVTQTSQFHGYSESNPITPELLNLANSVLAYWTKSDDSGRVLPKEYIYFTGDGEHNYFYTEWASNAKAWDWSLLSPYKEDITN